MEDVNDLVGVVFSLIREFAQLLTPATGMRGRAGFALLRHRIVLH
jgi:hypothetical protein